MKATRIRIAAALIASLAMGSHWAGADSIEAERVAKIKSAYLLNFLRFAEWPPHAFERRDSPVEICVLGRDSLGPALDGTVNGQVVGGRTIEVVRLEFGNDSAVFERIQRCHLVYIGNSEAPRLGRILGSLSGTDTLTVGETGSFAADGAMLALNLEHDRIIFYANPDAIRAGNVNLSSKILQLARIVHTGDRDGED